METGRKDGFDITIIEYVIETRNKCFGCKWLKLNEDKWYGYCHCPYNKIKDRNRCVVSKKCSWKNADKK